jgi:hypothetical protein
VKVFEVINLIGPNEFDRRGSKMKLPSMYKNKDYGSVSKVTPQTILVKSSGKDGKVYGRRTIMQKA